MPRQIPSQYVTTEEYSLNDVNKCVRYIIYRSKSNTTIKRSELKKHVLTNTAKDIDEIIEQASQILENVYGFKLIICDDHHTKSDKTYITAQHVDNHQTLYDTQEEDNVDEEEIPVDINKVLIMLVLTNIFMSENPINEAAMLRFLSTVGIEVNNDRGMFGKVQDFINITMVKQNYIELETDAVTREISYKWGPRARKTISKHKILSFVSKMYGDKQPTAWIAQYEEANQQFAQPNQAETVVIE